MSKNRWLETKNDQESKFLSTQFWKALKDDLDAGDFWSDRIKKYRDEPKKRLNEALDHLPLPAAFREAAISIRALIRERRKSNESYEEELTFLYWLAALHSFMIPFAKDLNEPGYNVMESIPGKKLKSLPFDYKSLGYKKLELLNKTDCKWIKEQWREPKNHSTLNEMHRELWNEYERKLIAKRKQGIYF
ncbi:MAG: hypothetical protein ABJR05_12680 [Balneola sp.]